MRAQLCRICSNKNEYFSSFILGAFKGEKAFNSNCKLKTNWKCWQFYLKWIYLWASKYFPFISSPLSDKLWKLKFSFDLSLMEYFWSDSQNLIKLGPIPALRVKFTQYWFNWKMHCDFSLCRLNLFLRTFQSFSFDHFCSSFPSIPFVYIKGISRVFSYLNSNIYDELQQDKININPSSDVNGFSNVNFTVWLVEKLKTTLIRFDVQFYACLTAQK